MIYSRDRHRAIPARTVRTLCVALLPFTLALTLSAGTRLLGLVASEDLL